MTTKQRVPGAAIVLRWWKGPPVLVIVPSGSEPAIQLTSEKARGALQIWVPKGPVVVGRLTNAEKSFLLKKGMYPGLFKSGRVFAVSNEAASRLDTDTKVLTEIAEKCGLGPDDLSRIREARRRLETFRPSTFDERRAQNALRAFLFPERSKKQRGRPRKITAEDRRLIHEDARRLKQEGKTTDEIVRVIAQRYELKMSYAKRILEDAPRYA